MFAVDEIDGLDSGALFSPCRRYRYLLWRRWEAELPVCAFVGLNPSTADELIDDPTVRRCIRYAKDWGYGSLRMLNLFAWRATAPVDMKLQRGNAIGPRNNEYLVQCVRDSDLTIAAWGTHGSFLERGAIVRKMFADARLPLSVLHLTRDGQPGHPLYLRADLQPISWPPFGL